MTDFSFGLNTRTASAGQSSAKSGRRSTKSGQLSDDAARRLVSYLRRQHFLKPLGAIAEEAGVSADAVRKWFDGTSAPGFLPLLRLIGVYGPDLLVAVFEEAPDWLVRARADQERVRFDTDLSALRERFEDLERLLR